jgi:hypothetical protein
MLTAFEPIETAAQREAVLRPERPGRARQQRPRSPVEYDAVAADPVDLQVSRRFLPVFCEALAS